MSFQCFIARLIMPGSNNEKFTPLAAEPWIQTPISLNSEVPSCPAMQVPNRYRGPSRLVGAVQVVESGEGYVTATLSGIQTRRLVVVPVLERAPPVGQPPWRMGGAGCTAVPAPAPERQKGWTTHARHASRTDAIRPQGSDSGDN